VRLPDTELDTLFAEPDEQIGSVEELGWYGLVRHEDQPGGYFLRCDEHGLRRGRGGRTQGAPDGLGGSIQQGDATFYEQRDAYELATAEPGQSEGGHAPRIWIGSLSDYNNGRLYGTWMDATLEPEELHAAVQFMLRNSDTPGAEEWAIFDYEDF